MPKLLILLAATTILAGVALEAEREPAQAAAATARPRIGTFGFDLAGMDRGVSAGDNFYRFANGSWAKTTPIPADKSNYGMFTVLDDLSRERTRTILQQAVKDPSSKIGAAFMSFTNEAGIESKGLTPITPWLNRIRSLSSKSGYAALFAEADRMGIGGPVGFYIGQDDKLPDVYAATMLQSGLGMPDRDYYLSSEANIVATRAAYVTYLETMLRLAGEANGAERAKAMLAYETEIARAHWTREDSRDAVKTYNKMTVRELEARAPGFDFSAYLRGVGANVESVIVSQPSALTGIAAAVQSAPLAVLKDELLVRSLSSYAAYLPKAIDQANFAFYGTVLSGTPQQEPRWKRGVDFVTDSVGDEVSKIYVARYFPPATKAAADRLVKNVIAAMGRRIDGLDWMSAEAKVKARGKLAAFTPKIGYPDRWRDYRALEIRRGDLFGNAVRSRRFEHDYQIGKLGKEIYRWEWGMTPMEVNAYANFGMIEIVFPAAILQPPFFDANADPAVNYGGIGAVIGHELSHQFDDQGAKYDATGRLAEWWTPSDVKNFEALGDRLAAQYDAYEPLPGMHIKGRMTLGENIADLAGLTVAYEAYKASLGGKPAPVIGGFTGDQRFYFGWAQVWRRNYREPNLRQRLLTDPHSPSEQRAAVVRNLDPWYAAFKVAPGQALYLPPDRRVRIW